MTQRYWVVGGEYTDTSFSTLAPGKKEVRLGPFDNYDEAKAVWRAKAMETIDEAYARFQIEREGHEQYWVIGGEYTDTDFKTIRDGGEEQRIGPFSSYEDARDEWKSRSMAAIDDAYSRFRIEKL